MLLKFLIALLFATPAFSSTQEQIRRKLFDPTENFTLHQPVCIVCGSEENLVSIKSCNHHEQCKGCLTEHIKSSLERGYLPQCIQGGCSTEIAYGTALHLFKGRSDSEQLMSLFEDLTIKRNPNIRCCPVDKKTLVESTCNDWHQYCSGCETVHCFQCGTSHDRTLSCLEASPEHFASLISVYRELRKTSPGLEWKVCPYCGTPAEKKDGCNEIKCGQNYHSNHTQLSSSLGCGRSFYWGGARVFDPDKKQDVGESTVRNNGQHVENDQNHAYNPPNWLVESQASDTYTEEVALVAATTNREPDFQPYIELFNERLSAWLDEKNITSPVNASKAFLALNAADNAARNAADNAAWYVAWYAAWNAADNAAWYAADNAAWYAAWYAARNAARNAAWNAAWNAADSGEAPEVVGRISYRIAERTALIYIYENLIDTLNAAYDAQHRPWRPSKSTLVTLLDRLNSDNNATEQLLSPFTHVIRQRVDQLPERRILGLW